MLSNWRNRPRPAEKKHRRSQVGRITGTSGKSAEDETVAARFVVATKRGNARGAKEPCCTDVGVNTEGRGGLINPPSTLQDLRQRLCVTAKAAHGLITRDVNGAGARSAVNPHAACDVAGTGNEITATPTRARRGKPWRRPRSCLRITAPVPDPSAAMLAAVPAGGSPADGSCPAAIVVILGDGKGDRLVGSPGVNVSVGWERLPVGSAREASESTGRSKSEPM